MARVKLTKPRQKEGSGKMVGTAAMAESVQKEKHDQAQPPQVTRSATQTLESGKQKQALKQEQSLALVQIMLHASVS